MTAGKIHPLILRDHGDVPPDWIYDLLTPSQADESRTSALWRWRALIAAVDLPGPTKAVAMWVAWHCNNDRLVCNPSLALLASEAGFTRKTVERATKTLEERGFLFVQRSRYERDERRKNNYYAPAWPARYPVADAAQLCGEEGHRGKPCRRPAGWGVRDADAGPCKYHVTNTPAKVLQETSGEPHEGSPVDEMWARDALRRAGESPGAGHEMPACRAGESPKRSTSVLFEGSKQRVARAASDVVGDITSDTVGSNDRDAERHAVLLALLQDEKERSEGEGLGDWSSEFEDLLEVERVRGMAG
jgi:hypothetical protein